MPELDNSLPEQEKPTKQQTPAASSFFEKLKTKWPKIILTAIFGLALLAGAAYAGYWYGTTSSNLKSLSASGGSNSSTKNNLTI